MDYNKVKRISAMVKEFEYLSVRKRLIDSSITFSKWLVLIIKTVLLRFNGTEIGAVKMPKYKLGEEIEYNHERYYIIGILDKYSYSELHIPHEDVYILCPHPSFTPPNFSIELVFESNITKNQ